MIGVRRYRGHTMFGRLYIVAFGIFLVRSNTGLVLANASFDRFGSNWLGRAAVRDGRDPRHAARPRHAKATRFQISRMTRS